MCAAWEQNCVATETKGDGSWSMINGQMEHSETDIFFICDTEEEKNGALSNGSVSGNNWACVKCMSTNQASTRKLVWSFIEEQGSRWGGVGRLKNSNLVRSGISVSSAWCSLHHPTGEERQETDEGGDGEEVSVNKSHHCIYIYVDNLDMWCTSVFSYSTWVVEAPFTTAISILSQTDRTGRCCHPGKQEIGFLLPQTFPQRESCRGVRNWFS